MEVYYDDDIHDTVSNLRKLDGTIPVHPQYGVPLNFFAPKRAQKYWTKASTPELGYFIRLCFCIILIFVIILIVDMIEQIFSVPRSG